MTDESGNFSLTLIPIGDYEVAAEAQGFKKAVIDTMTLRVNEARRINFTMDVGQVSESVTVAATAVAVNTASGTTSQLLDGQEMVKLPSRGRYVFPYALLMPGVISDTPYDRSAVRSWIIPNARSTPGSTQRPTSCRRQERSHRRPATS